MINYLINARLLFGLALCGFALLSPPASLRAAGYYNYQSYDGNGVGGAVGNATLALSNNNYTVYANFVKGIGSFSDNLVIFIDTVSGGYSTTGVFSDYNNAQEASISGYRGLSRSTANFAPGFQADYAIVLGINIGSGIYKLVDDGTGPHVQLIRDGLNFVFTDSPNHPSYSFQFDWADLGLPNRNTNFFKFETSYISSNGYRSLQSFEDLTGEEGYKTINFTNYDTYGVPPVPENTTSALAVFGGLAGVAALGKRFRRPSGLPTCRAPIRTRQAPR